MAVNQFVEAAPSGGVAHFGEAMWDKLVDFASFITEEGEKRGLVGPRELERLWSRHILNSLPISDFIDEDSTVIDVGSGAGFPGLILAITRPDCSVTLIDSMDRRCQWLTDCVSLLELDNVRVLHGRAEEFHGTLYADVVTARAVAAVKKLLPWTMPFLQPGGRIVALKGERVGDEIDAAISVLHKYRAAWADIHVVKPFGCQEETRVLEILKK